MSSWKHIGVISTALIPLIMAGCHNIKTADYQRVPYCCDRTAGIGTEINGAEAHRQHKRVAMAEPTSLAPSSNVSTIEPAAGDEGDHVFSKAVEK